MAIQVALNWNDDTEKELLELGFEKQEVYIKTVDRGDSAGEKKRIGDGQFLGMRFPPSKFFTTCCWGSYFDNKI